jgi:hypothetical protein
LIGVAPRINAFAALGTPPIRQSTISHFNDFVADFEDGTDVIRITSVALDLSGVMISAQGGDTLIHFANVCILPENTDASLIGAGDFVFG